MFWTRNQKNGKYAVVAGGRKPLARSEDLIVQEVDGEVLVYDDTWAHAHCLSAEAARIWRACDGTKTVHALSDELGLSEDALVMALAELEAKELLDPGEQTDESAGGATRREFGLRAAKLGAAAATAPMIVSIVAPTPAAAATPTEAQCNFFSGSSCSACDNICGCCC